MKVLHVIVDLKIGGAELMLKRLIESDPANLTNTVVVSLISLGTIGQHLRDRNVRVHALGMSSALGAPIILWHLVRLIQLYQPKIVQTWMYHADLLGGLAAHLAGNHRVVWGIRMTETRAGGVSTATAIVRWLCARLSGWVPSVIVCAAEASRDSHVAIGYSRNKILVVPNGIDFTALRAVVDQRLFLREQCGINRDDVVVGSLGRFHLHKDPKNFVLAAGLLAPKYPKLKFLMVGRCLEWSNMELATWINKTGCKDQFVLLGEREDVPACLAAMDIFCLHSYTEGFPNALAEAMAMGLPCVATDVGDTRKLLLDTGVVVPKGKSAALSQGIAQLLALGPDGRHELGIRAKARVETEFSITLTRDRFEEIYRNLLNSLEVYRL